MNKTKESALDKFLKAHRRTCAYFIYSGDRHCSCGRDESIAELQKLRSEQIEQLSFFMLPVASMEPA